MKSNNLIKLSNQIGAGTVLEISGSSGINLESGFEIQLGGELTIDLTCCPR